MFRRFNGFRAAVVCAVAALLSTPAVAGTNGACCLPDGQCVVLPESLCAGQSVGGQYQGGGTTCPSGCVPFGACCLMDLACMDITEAECANIGGLSLLDQRCKTAVCPVRGACCLGSGGCNEGLTHDTCAAAGGLYQGFQTTCATTLCVGACVRADGVCVDDSARDACTDAGGTYLGDGSGCAPDTPMLIEAQCVTFSYSQNTTNSLPIAPFDTMGGTRGLTKVTVFIRGEAIAKTRLLNTGTNPLVTVLGIIERLDVIAPSLTPLTPVNIQGELIECTDDLFPGESCDFGGGMSWEGTDMAMSMEPNVLTLYDGGPISVDVIGVGNVSFQGSQFILTQAPHTIEGTVKVFYEFARNGACCFEDNSCQQGSAAACEDANGVFQGFGTMCIGTTCPADTDKGACCLSGATCTDMTQANCLIQGGFFQGIGSLCATTDCGGACCYVGSGSCSYILESRCRATGGFFLGTGVPCANGACPSVMGACCLPDQTCQVVSPVTCGVSFDGDYQGDDSSCATSCAMPLSGCCFGEMCIMMPQDGCATNGGKALGRFMTCQDNECDVVDLCFEDLNGSGNVGFDDLIVILAEWGECKAGCGDADLNASGAIDFDDLIAVLAAWGDC